jgi:hypothetical protein
LQAESAAWAIPYLNCSGAATNGNPSRPATTIDNFSKPAMPTFPPGRKADRDGRRSQKMPDFLGFLRMSACLVTSRSSHRDEALDLIFAV